MGVIEPKGFKEGEIAAKNGLGGGEGVKGQHGGGGIRRRRGTQMGDFGGGEKVAGGEKGVK